MRHYIEFIRHHNNPNTRGHFPHASNGRTLVKEHRMFGTVWHKTAIMTSSFQYPQQERTASHTEKFTFNSRKVSLPASRPETGPESSPSNAANTVKSEEGLTKQPHASIPLSKTRKTILLVTMASAGLLNVRCPCPRSLNLEVALTESVDRFSPSNRLLSCYIPLEKPWKSPRVDSKW